MGRKYPGRNGVLKATDTFDGHANNPSTWRIEVGGAIVRVITTGYPVSSRQALVARIHCLKIKTNKSNTEPDTETAVGEMGEVVTVATKKRRWGPMGFLLP